MNHSATEMCYSVTALGFSLSSMKTVVRVSSSCDSVQRSKNLHLPWLKNEETISHPVNPQKNGRVLNFSCQVLQQFCWCCRNCLRLHCSNRRALHSQNFPMIYNQWYQNIPIDSSYNALFNTTSHTLDHVANHLLVSFSCSIIFIDSSKVDLE